MSVQAGTVVRYTPDPSRHDPSWCREGTAIANPKGKLLDTYWGVSEAHALTDGEAATAVVMFRIDDYDELDQYAHSSPATWATYHPRDREQVTSQHGLQSRWFVRKGAAPDLATQIENAKEAVEAAENAVLNAQTNLRWKRDDLGRLT